MKSRKAMLITMLVTFIICVIVIIVCSNYLPRNKEKNKGLDPRIRNHITRIK